MQNYRSYLPNLDSLIAFEAAARHESFTLAAQELNLTQSAVSHRIRTLEESLKIELFERSHRAIRLTRDGSEFHSSVVVALNHLVAASDTIKGERAPTRLKVCTDIAFANFWLEPRLPTLLRAVPDVAVDLTASDEFEMNFSRSIDISILLGNGDWPGYDTTFLFPEEIFPVCSPNYLEQVGPIETVEALAAADLIDLSFDKSAWLNWTIWLAEKGGPRGGIRRVFQSNSYQAVIAAARDGRGIALGWRNIVEEYLLTGALVVPFQASVRTGNGYYLICPNNQAENPAIRAFRNWARVEVAKQKVFPLHE